MSGSESAPTGFLSGVIEGFYGRPWPMETRLAYIDYLKYSGLNSYLYCPKADPFLRTRWQQHWPGPLWQQLQQLGVAYRDGGIHWGVGLSPVQLYREYGPVQRKQLREKIEKLLELDSTLLGILFDDMPGNIDALAERQAEITRDVCEWAPGRRVMVCPTYYSYDPVLEQYFGTKPTDYWAQLGRALPASVDIFWTGSKVCSSQIEVADIESITGALGRAVTLWDNYPVNDGAVRSNFLYTSKLTKRSRSLRPMLRGHLCNPMNQGLLSLPALSGLADLYGYGNLDDSALSRFLGSRTWEQLVLDRADFELKGLSGMGEKQCTVLASKYSRLPGRAAEEIAQWLRGEFAFDPACLTV